ncbi:MAG: hypothetical protein KIT83_18575 [Bryobacterales bacterium]|nr:hypothetical protein [Bryobacterales bacterium]
MSSLLDLALFLLLAAGHAPLLFRAVSSLRHGYVPPAWQFGALGVMLFYDLGLMLQFWGLPYRSSYFPELAHAGEDERTMVVMVVLAAPYLLWLGSRLVTRDRYVSSELHVLRFAPKMQVLFAVMLLPPSLALAAFGVSAVWGAASIAAIKMEWLQVLGSAYLAFMAPMFAVAFLVRTDFSRRPPGRVLVIVMVACSTGATLFLGQRTMTLLPLLILFLFYFRFRLRWAIAGLALIVSFAAGMVWFYKGYAVDQNMAFEERLVKVVNDDFTRGNVLMRALQESEVAGTKVLAVPGQGYLYAASLYIPRAILPQKGYSTTAYFTGVAIGQDVEFLNWGLGVGFLEQICLNFGLAALLPGVMVYGMGLGLLDLVRRRMPGTLVGGCLGAVWISGYDAAAVILYFGSMVIFAALLEMVFSSSNPQTRQAASAPIGLQLRQPSLSS